MARSYRLTEIGANVFEKLSIDLETGAAPDPLTRIIVICERRRYQVESLVYDRFHAPGRGRVVLGVDGGGRSADRLASWLANLVGVLAVSPEANELEDEAE